MKKKVLKEVVRTFLGVEQWVDRERFVTYAVRKLRVPSRMLWNELKSTKIEQDQTPQRTEIKFQIQAAIRDKDLSRTDVKKWVFEEVFETLLRIKNERELTECVTYAAKELRINVELMVVDFIEFQVKRATGRRNFHQSPDVQRQIIEEVVRTYLQIEKWMKKRMKRGKVCRIRLGRAWHPSAHDLVAIATIERRKTPTDSCPSSHETK